MIAECWREIDDSFSDIIMSVEGLDVNFFLASTSGALSAFCDRFLTADIDCDPPTAEDYFVQLGSPPPPPKRSPRALMRRTSAS